MNRGMMMRKAFNSVRNRFRYSDREMPFLEHLEEFRRMLIHSGITIFVAMVIVAFFVPWMIRMLLAPGQEYIDAGRIVLQMHELPAGFKIWFMLAFWGGLIVSMPVLMLIIGSFILPGIKDSERRVVQRIGFFSGVLFVAGVCVGYYVTLPVAIGVLIGMNERMGGVSMIFYQKYIEFTLHVLLGFGVALQMPVVIITLGRVGLLNSLQLRKVRRHVIVGMFVLAMILTPPDWVSQLQLAIPLILLYEFCIWFLYFSEGGGKRAGKSLTEE